MIGASTRTSPFWRVGWARDGGAEISGDNISTSGSLAGSNDRALAITDHLIAQIRKGG